LNGLEFVITGNLYAALFNLRSRFKERILWIDAICIDQNNILERNEQVRRMGQIYRSASRVVAWLGDEYDNSALAFSFIREITQGPGEGDIDIGTFAEHNPCLKALIVLFSRDYFRRLWIVQEVTLAKDVFVCCGQETMEWDQLLYGQILLRDA